MVMATTKPISPPVRPADMTREEAETVTKQIKENFDSLGNMLLAAREQKAYRALGYRSFESYCQSEFGKSSSTAYQAIEDAKVRSQLEARISENYGEDITLKFPSSHLRPLKAVGDLDDKLKVLEYAQKLAAGEGKKPTKQHLEIAVFEISGKRSEDFRAAIQKLGFTKGVQVEAVSPIKKDRGIVTHLDKAGLIYVEHHYGSTKAVPYRATELRILTNEEKPTNPLEGSVASKGDRVLIFAEGLQGQQGTIYTWQEGKTTLVMIDGQKSPTVIAYAELELIKTLEPKNADWESELVWESGKNTYYYFPREDKIYSNRWPVGLTLEPYTHSGSPIDFMKNWETRFSDGVLESLATPANLKTLVLQQAIELPEKEGQEFVSDLIASLLQLFPQPDTNKTAALLQENERLREQLAEAEAAIEAIVEQTKTTTSAETATGNDYLAEFLLENASDNSNIEKDDWRSVLTTNNFSILSDFWCASEPTEIYRDWTIYLDSPNGAITAIDLNHPLKGSFCRSTHDLPDSTILKFTKKVINQVEDFCPGQLSFNLATSPSTTPDQIEVKLSPEICERLEFERNKATDKINHNQTKKFNQANKTNKKEIERLDKSTADQQAKLEQLNKFSEFRVGQTICHKRDPLILGKIIKLEFSEGGMPLIWVKYFKDGELEKTPISELVSMIFQVEI